MIKDIKNFKIVHPEDVLVEVQTVKNEVASSTGIVLTMKASQIEDRKTRGVVLAVGSGISSLEVGDVVEFEIVAGQEIKIDNELEVHYLLMDIGRVLGIYS